MSQAGNAFQEKAILSKYLSMSLSDYEQPHALDTAMTALNNGILTQSDMNQIWAYREKVYQAAWNQVTNNGQNVKNMLTPDVILEETNTSYSQGYNQGAQDQYVTDQGQKPNWLMYGVFGFVGLLILSIFNR